MMTVATVNFRTKMWDAIGHERSSFYNLGVVFGRFWLWFQRRPSPQKNRLYSSKTVIKSFSLPTAVIHALLPYLEKLNQNSREKSKKFKTGSTGCRKMWKTTVFGIKEAQNGNFNLENTSFRRDITTGRSQNISRSTYLNSAVLLV